MGGNALKNCFTRRYDKNEYLLLSKEVINRLAKSEEIYKMAIPYSYRNKESFGDLDVLISIRPKFDLADYIKNTFNPKEIVSNGECLSFEFKEFQVDLIKANDNFNSNLEYLNWNDLGNLIGRVAHKFGLKYGHKGLLFVIKNESGYNPKELTISTDTRKVLEFLGFDFDRYTFGFDSVKEIYDFVISSKYFNPEIFSFEAMNHINRVRNKKRVTYQGFIDYLESIKLGDYGRNNFFEYNKNKEVYLPRLNYYFPELNIFKFINDYNFELEQKDLSRKKFNGELVTEITNLTGKELGEFIAYFKNIFLAKTKTASDTDFNSWINSKKADEIIIILKDALNEYNTKNI